MISRWVLIISLLLPNLVVALGLGKLDLNSSLNEPFDARIELLSPTVEELDSLKVGLASPEAFARAGLDRPFILSQLKFEVRESEEGPDYVRVYSSEAIREPFLNFLLEINWNRGRLYREYTVLLDPPMYEPKRMAAEVFDTAVDTSPGPEYSQEGHVVQYDLDYKASTTTPTPTPTPSISYSGGGDYGPTSAGDTLWSIAQSMRPDNSISVQQMMMALFRANPDAFINNNINTLKRGQILRMPDLSEIQALSKQEAFDFTKTQNAQWNDLRGVLAEAAEQQPESPGISSPSSAEMETSAAETMAEAELRLVAPGDAGEGIDQPMEEGAESMDDGQDLALANESIAALEMENIELKSKLTESEGIIEDLKRLIELKEDELAAMQNQIAAAEAEVEEMPSEMEAEVSEAMEEPVEEITAEMEEEPAEAEPMMAAEEEAAEAAVAEEETVAETEAATYTAPDAGIMGIVSGGIDFVMSNLVMVAGAVGGILVLLLGYVFYNKRQVAEPVAVSETGFPDFDEEITEQGTTSDELMDLEESEAETEIPQEDMTPTPQVPAEEAIESVSPPGEETVTEAPVETEEDPLAEVNVFLAYEHFDQAEEFVKNAIEREPDNLDFHTKLLEVYYAANNKKGYEDAARVLHDKVNGEGEHWDMAVAMWSEMSPNRALFEGAGEEEIADKMTDTGGGIVDITSGAGEMESAAEDEGLEFDMGEAEEDILDVTAAGDVEDILDVTAATEGEEDILDITAAVGLGTETEESVAEEADEVEEDVLDLTGSGEEENVLDITGGAPEEDMLDITGGIEEEDLLDVTKSEGTEEEDVLDLSQGSGSDLLDVTASANLSADTDEEVLDVTAASASGADSMDLLDMETPAETEEETTEDESSLDFDLEGLDLDLPSTEESGQESDDSSMIERAVSDKEEDNVIDFDLASSSKDEEEIEGTIEVEPSSLGIEPSEESVDEGGIDLDLTIGEGDEGPAAEESGLDIDLADTSGIETVETEDEISLDLEALESAEETQEGELGLELEIDTGEGETNKDEPDIDMEGTVEMPKIDMDILESEDEDDEEEKTVFVPKSNVTEEQSLEDEVATKLDLAKAYVELGDKDSAKTILDEIIDQGNDEQKQQAQELLNQVS